MSTAFHIARGWNSFALAAAISVAVPAGAQSVDEESSESLSRSQAIRQACEGAGDLVDPQDVSRRIVQQTNAFREAEGRSTISTNPELEEAARYFAHYMARTDRYGHTADGKRPAERAREHGYELCIVTENIAYQYSTRPFNSQELARRFVEGWKESPQHRDNMLDPDVTQTGVAIAQSSETDHYYAVQIFGRPQELSIELRVENRSDTEVGYAVADREFSLPPRYIRTHQHCRPMELKFQIADPAEEAGRTQTVRVDSDANFVIVRGEGGALRVHGEAPSQSNPSPTAPNRQE